MNHAPSLPERWSRTNTPETGLVCLVDWFVLFIWLIWFIWLASLNQTNETNQTNLSNQPALTGFRAVNIAG